MTTHTKKERRVVFFNFALKDGHFMARPIFNANQSLVGETIQALERFNPRFAWIQFLFSQRDYNYLLMQAKAELENYIRLANTSSYDERTKQKIPSNEINTQWYKFAAQRIKRIEQILSKPTVILAVNGMWVANGNGFTNSAHQIRELPFSLCSDEIDRLQPFLYGDPRVLKMLIDRRMVTDISPSICKYSRSRDEPPSLILSPEEIPYYIHMPTGASARGLSTIKPAAHFPVGATLVAQEVMPKEDTLERPGEDIRGQMPIFELKDSGLQIHGLGQLRRYGETGWNGEQKNVSISGWPPLAALKKVPTLEEPLEKEEEQRLSQITSRNVRTFELLYDSEEGTRVLLSSSCETTGDDLESVYIPQLESVYGKLDYELLSDTRPEFVVEELPKIVNLSAIHG
jgi:hypothetical protein